MRILKLTMKVTLMINKEYLQLRISEKPLTFKRRPFLEFFHIYGKNYKLETIHNAFCNFFGITEEILAGKSHQHIHTRPRFVYIAVLAANGIDFNTIGKILGGRDHSTCIHGVDTLKDLLDTDSTFKSNCDQLMEILYNMVETDVDINFEVKAFCKLVLNSNLVDIQLKKKAEEILNILN